MVALLGGRGVAIASAKRLIAAYPRDVLCQLLPFFTDTTPAECRVCVEKLLLLSEPGRDGALCSWLLSRVVIALRGGPLGVTLTNAVRLVDEAGLYAQTFGVDGSEVVLYLRGTEWALHSSAMVRPYGDTLRGMALRQLTAARDDRDLVLSSSTVLFRLFLFSDALARDCLQGSQPLTKAISVLRQDQFDYLGLVAQRDDGADLAFALGRLGSWSLAQSFFTKEGADLFWRVAGLSEQAAAVLLVLLQDFDGDLFDAIEASILLTSV